MVDRIFRFKLKHVRSIFVTHKFYLTLAQSSYFMETLLVRFLGEKITPYSPLTSALTLIRPPIL